MRRKDPRFDLRLKYKRSLELALIISLLLVSGVFLASKEFHFAPKIKLVESIVIKVEDIPVTAQIRHPPPPAPPIIPIEDPEADIEPDIQPPINEPPNPDSYQLPSPILVIEEYVPWYLVEEEPVLIGGVQALLDYIKKNNLYPTMAQTAESNGDVIVQFTVDKTGKVTDPIVSDERPKNLGFGDAAVQAILAMKFTPGKQRDKPVSVRMQQTIRFRIK